MIKLRLYNKFFLILTFFWGFSCFYAQKKITIVLDAGHGGSDNGATRYYGDLGTVMEKDITLGIVLKLGRMLEKNKDYKVIYTRKTDEFPSLTYRTTLANRSKADLFISVHVNSSPSKSATANGSETFVQGPNQNKANLDVAKAENDVIFLDDKDKENFASYNPSSPESLIALKIQQSKYLEASLAIGGFVEDNFEKKNKRYSRGVKQANLHVLRMNAMPSILIETGFVNNYDDAYYLSSEEGQKAISQSIYDAIESYKNLIDRNSKRNKVEPEPQRFVEQTLKNDFRILLMSSPNKYNENALEFKGLKYILPIKENGFYKYYYSTTNLASVRDTNLKYAKDTGFRNAMAISFVPNQNLRVGYYTLEVYSGKDKLDSRSIILRTIPDVSREKDNGLFLYIYGKYKSLEDAINAMKDFEKKGIRNIIIEKKLK